MALSIIAGITALGMAVLFGGCTTCRDVNIPQVKAGPHDGALFLNDQSDSEYVEFVARPV